MTDAAHPVSPPDFIAFEGPRCLARGPLADVALQVKAATEARPLARFMVFNALSSEIIDYDHRGSTDEVLARLALAHPLAQVLAPASASSPTPTSDASTDNGALPRSGPGRPKLGVVAREVTLLPRHWAWLAGQPGGASVALRKLVDQARKDSLAHDQRRLSQEASYRFMSAMAGSLEGFEEAARSLFAADRSRFEVLISPWPADIQTHLLQLAQAALVPVNTLNPSEQPHA
ncbi:DUF2239 family protein [Limnohabitans sp. T6-20]|uniref:DUF2239 family protein n=1 Tax=Limnohabitans sp. T6-20 TaxID=1100725 RepID=UPI000DD1F7AE|nr:DUF2239 family protein [Limnohabitans sp. T6-20]PUE10615.1 hypothetical protein B9Z33_07990 [Limnohabitans sp. T6-20]